MNQITPFYSKEPSITGLTSWLHQEYVKIGMHELCTTGK